MARLLGAGLGRGARALGNGRWEPSERCAEGSADNPLLVGVARAGPLLQAGAVRRGVGLGVTALVGPAVGQVTGDRVGPLRLRALSPARWAPRWARRYA